MSNRKFQQERAKNYQRHETPKEKEDRYRQALLAIGVENPDSDDLVFNDNALTEAYKRGYDDAVKDYEEFMAPYISGLMQSLRYLDQTISQIDAIVALILQDKALVSALQNKDNELLTAFNTADTYRKARVHGADEEWNTITIACQERFKGIKAAMVALENHDDSGLRKALNSLRDAISAHPLALTEELFTARMGINQGGHPGKKGTTWLRKNWPKTGKSAHKQAYDLRSELEAEKAVVIELEPDKAEALIILSEERTPQQWKDYRISLFRGKRSGDKTVLSP